MEKPMDRTKQQLGSYASMLETALAGYLPRHPSPEQTVADAMAYSLLSGGKRIRGALTLAFYRLFREDVRPALPYAGALEMVHAYSLIHDDLPCMDDDDLRRGKPSCHIAYGEATALLAGDALLTLAFETMTDPRHAGAFAPGAVVKAVRCLAAAAGCAGMIGGQMIDLYQEGKPASEELLKRTYAKKTGALIAAAAQMGCVLAGARPEETEAAESYCEKIGLAFQIVDDLLDVTGDARVLGKPIGSDIENKKCTYVSIYGLDAARQKVDQLNQEAKASLQKLKGDTSFLASLADLLAGRQN